MLEKPDIPDQIIISTVQESYGVAVSQLTFLPLGADANTAVYRVDSKNGSAYFLKLRKGKFDEITVAVPQFLKSQGIDAIIAPLETHDHQLWTSLDPFKLILYPFMDGQDGYTVNLSESQWHQFGAALKRIHTAQVPPALARLIPHETFSPQWRRQVKTFQAMVEEITFDDPTAARLAACMKAQKNVIDYLVGRAEVLGLWLQSRSLDLTLCHSDIHPGNLLIGDNQALYLVDWDNPVFAPKERDLLLIGGCFTWHDAHYETLFYRGYGQTEIDRPALAYYRCERIIQDIAAFCTQLLATQEGGKDREQGLTYFTSNFLPGHEIELALMTE